MAAKNVKRGAAHQLWLAWPFLVCLNSTSYNPSIISQKTNQGQHFWVPLNSHCLRKSFWRRLAPTMPQSLHLGYGKAALQNVPPGYEYVCPNQSKQLIFLWLVSKIGHVKEEKLSPAKNEVFGSESFAMTCFLQMPFFCGQKHECSCLLCYEFRVPILSVYCYHNM